VKTQSTILPALSGVLFAGVFVLAGAYIMSISFDVIHVPPENFHAPRFVTAAAGIVFVMFGLMLMTRLMAGDYGSQSPLFQWVQYFLMVVGLLSFSAVFLWAGFGSGAHAFVQTTTVGGISNSEPASESSGRLIFGGF